MTNKKPSKIMPPKTLRDADIEKHKNKANDLNEAAEEFGGQQGADPTRFADWEKGGRCTDF